MKSRSGHTRVNNNRFGGVKNERVHRHKADAGSGDVVAEHADVVSEAVDLHRFLLEFGRLGPQVRR
jgi:hypothetical protein